jgi:hypothetical protein
MGGIKFDNRGGIDYDGGVVVPLKPLKKYFMLTGVMKEV